MQTRTLPFLPVTNLIALLCRSTAIARLAVVVLLILLGGLGPQHSAAAAQTAAGETVHLYGQIRDTAGTPRQGLVVVSTYLGPDLVQAVSSPDGFYSFDLPPMDHYVVTVFPLQRQALGSSEVPDGFLDRWERIERTNESDLLLDVTVIPGGAILLEAYDPQGQFIYEPFFPHHAMFAIYAIGQPPVTDPLNVGNHQRPLVFGWQTLAGRVNNPAVLMLPSNVDTPFTVWGLWSVPEAGTIMLELDNGGQGYQVQEGQPQTINLVYEIARTELRKVQEKLFLKVREGYVFPADLATWLAQAESYLQTARAQLEVEDGAGAAVTSYPALTLAIRAKENLALEVARQDIEKRRQPVGITLLGMDGKPLSNVRVDYQQTNHDFVLSGSWGGEAGEIGETLETRQRVGDINLYATIAREIGFEYLNFPPYPAWGSIQRGWPDIPYRFDDSVILDKMAARGFRSTGNSIWFVSSPQFYPSFIEDLPYAQVKAAALEFLKTTVGHYAGKIQLWNVMNEPNFMNNIGFTTEEMLDFTKAVVDMTRSTDPQAKVVVVLSSTGLGYFGGGPGDVDILPGSAINPSTYAYLKEMQAAGIHPDAIGIQFYNGATLPAIDLGTASDLLDFYGQEFDLPFYIEELEYPTHEDYPGLFNISNYWGWHQGHTDQAQADWAVGMFSLAFSKPYLMGANWSMSVDLPAYRVENGRAGDGYLHTDGITLRPMAAALRNLFQSWTVSGTSQTGADGQAGFAGFAGDYLLTLTDPNGAVHQESIHISEMQANNFSFTLDLQQTLDENRQSAAVALDKVTADFEWADGLGRSNGVDSAENLFSDAQIAFATGHFWQSLDLANQARQDLTFRIDGKADDWSGMTPLFTLSEAQGQAQNTQLRDFYAAFDETSLVLQFKFDTPSPQREFLFELDVGVDGISDFSVTISPLGSDTLLFAQKYVGNPADIFTHLIPSIDALYGSTVEVRIPLSDLGNPESLALLLYREDIGDGSISGLIPSLGMITDAYPRHNPVALQVEPALVSLLVGETQQFSVKGLDSAGQEVAISPVWTTSGGSITPGGLYTAGVAGFYTVSASLADSYLSGTGQVTVETSQVNPVSLAEGTQRYYLSGALIEVTLLAAAVLGLWLLRRKRRG